MGHLVIKWEIIVIFVLGVIVSGCWLLYGIKKDKLSIKPILKQENGNEPLALSPVLDLKYFQLIRLLFAIYAFIVWIYANIDDGPRMYSFYTVWNYTLLLFYFTSVTIFTFITNYSKYGVPDTRFFNYYRSFVWMIFQCECTLALLVDLTVWFILVPFSSNPLKFLNFTSISMHILNLIFLFIDLSLNSLPIHFHYGAFVTIIGLCYIVFSWLYYAQTSKWDYFFMDTSKPGNAIWLTLVFTLHLLSWTFVWKLAQYKQNYHSKKQSGNDVIDVGLLQA